MQEAAALQAAVEPQNVGTLLHYFLRKRSELLHFVSGIREIALSADDGAGEIPPVQATVKVVFKGEALI